tara:strand:+ start:71 stop:547 length:477 start_codon:yes stop_codon:yes gene_type:complete
MSKLLTKNTIKNHSTEYDGVTKNGKNFTKKLSYTDIENNWSTYSNKVSVLRNLMGLVGIKGIDFQYGKANTQKKGDLIAILDKKENSKYKKLIMDTYEQITLKSFSDFMETGYVANKIANSKKKTVKKNKKNSKKSELKTMLEGLSKSELLDLIKDIA